MSPALIVLLLILLISLVLFLVFRQGSKRQFMRFSQQIAALSKALSLEGLTLSEGVYSSQGTVEEPQLKGQSRHGFEFEIFSDKPSVRQDGLATYIEFKLSNPRNLDLMIFPEHLSAKLGKMLGMSDVQLGQKSLDEAFIFRSSQPEDLVLLLDADLRQALLAQKPAFVGSLQLEGETLRYKYPFYMDSEAHCQKMVQMFHTTELFANKIANLPNF